MELLLTIRVVHIFSGALALISGLLALGFSPKVKRHRPMGKVFFYAMTSVFFTAVFLAVKKHIDFLFCIAILSYFSTLFGIRSLKFMKGNNPRWFDWALLCALAIAGFFLIGKGAFGWHEIGSMELILSLVFGSGMLLYAFTSALNLTRIPVGNTRWLNSHQANMGAALIATITAFSTTALSFLPGLVAWLGPTLILSPMLAYYINRPTRTK